MYHFVRSRANRKAVILKVKSKTYKVVRLLGLALPIQVFSCRVGYNTKDYVEVSFCCPFVLRRLRARWVQRRG